MSYRCPKCGSKELEVTVSAWARLYQEGGEVTGTVTEEARCGDHDWDEDSPMMCCDCDYAATAKEFER